MPRSAHKARFGTLVAGLSIVLVRFVAAAPFTAGNVIVATAPSSGLQQAAITVAEYAPAFGAAVQAYTIPASGTPPIGSTENTAITAMQIAFPDDNNQQLYVATTWTNVSSGSRRAGFLRVSAAGPTLAADEAFENGVGAVLCRGVAAAGGYVFTSTGSGSARNVGAMSELYFSGNARWIEAFGGQLYVSSSGSLAPFSGPGIYKTGLADSAPAVLSKLFPVGLDGALPLGFAVTDANTIYVAVHVDGGGLVAGLYKWTFGGGVWTAQGRRNTMTEAISDVDVAVSGTTVTLYAISDTSVWKLTDTLASTGSAWTDAPAATVLTGLSRGRAIAVVPGAGVPVCSCAGDLVPDQKVNGNDIEAFVRCLLGGPGPCDCGDFNNSGGVTVADIGPFVSRLLTFTTCS